MESPFKDGQFTVARQLTPSAGGLSLVLPRDTLITFLVVGNGGSGGTGGSGGGVSTGTFVTPADVDTVADAIVQERPLPGQLADANILILNNGLTPQGAYGGASLQYTGFPPTTGPDGAGGPGLPYAGPGTGTGGPGVEVTLWDGSKRVFGAGGASAEKSESWQSRPRNTGGGRGRLDAEPNSGSGGAGGTPENPDGGLGALGQVTLWWIAPEDVISLDTSDDAINVNDSDGRITITVDNNVYIVDNAAASSEGPGSAAVFSQAAEAAQRVLRLDYRVSSNDLYNISTNDGLLESVRRAQPQLTKALAVAAGKPTTYTRPGLSPTITTSATARTSFYGGAVRLTPAQAAIVISLRDDPNLTREDVRFALQQGLPLFFVQDIALRTGPARQRVFIAAGVNPRAATVEDYL